MARVTYQTRKATTAFNPQRVEGLKDELLNELKKATEWLDSAVRSYDHGDISIEINIYV